MVWLNNPTIFLIDFSLVWLFCNPTMYLHIPYSTDQLVISTLQFTSINGQRGYAQSCHNNLDSQYLHSVLLQCLQTETVQTDKVLLSAHSPVDDRHTPIFSDRV